MRRVILAYLASASLFVLAGPAEAQTQCCGDPLIGFYLSSSGRCQRLPPGTDDPRLAINGWPADPADCTRPYCFDPKAKLGWRPVPNDDFSCRSSQRIDKPTYEALFSRGEVYQGSPPP
jgi:hypothetical protein